MKNVPFYLLLTFSVFFSCQKEAIVPPTTPPPLDPPIYVPIFEPGDTLKGAAYALKLTKDWTAFGRISRLKYFAL